MKKKVVFEDGFLFKIVPQIKDSCPLFLLDSAGGLGLLEFQTVTRLMGNKEFYLILDDIHHLKHFRSFQEICKNPSFIILAKNIEQGWVIARHMPSST